MTLTIYLRFSPSTPVGLEAKMKRITLNQTSKPTLRGQRRHGGTDNRPCLGENDNILESPRIEGRKILFGRRRMDAMKQTLGKEGDEKKNQKPVGKLVSNKVTMGEKQKKKRNKQMKRRERELLGQRKIDDIFSPGPSKSSSSSRFFNEDAIDYIHQKPMEKSLEGGDLDTSRE